MPADYQQINDPVTGKPSGTILRRSDNAYIPDDMANKDRQIFVEWCEAGHTPDPPDPAPKPVPAQTSGPFAPGAGAAQAGVAALTQRIEALEARLTHVEMVIRK